MEKAKTQATEKRNSMHETHCTQTVNLETASQWGWTEFEPQGQTA